VASDPALAVALREVDVAGAVGDEPRLQHAERVVDGLLDRAGVCVVP
jgi:hypothetical protein